MIPDIDIYRSANLLVKQHGQDTPIHAAMRADAMLEAGDLDGYAVWKRILRAVGELQGVAEGGARGTGALNPVLVAGLLYAVPRRNNPHPLANSQRAATQKSAFLGPCKPAGRHSSPGVTSGVITARSVTCRAP